MKVEKSYLVGIHRYSYNAGKPGEIIGLVWMTPMGLPKRLCYHVKWKDGTQDYFPVIDSANIRIISEADFKAKRIPEVVN